MILLLCDIWRSSFFILFFNRDISFCRLFRSCWVFVMSPSMAWISCSNACSSCSSCPLSSVGVKARTKKLDNNSVASSDQNTKCLVEIAMYLVRSIQDTSCTIQAADPLFLFFCGNFGCCLCLFFCLLFLLNHFHILNILLHGFCQFFLYLFCGHNLSDYGFGRMQYLDAGRNLEIFNKDTIFKGHKFCNAYRDLMGQFLRKGLNFNFVDILDKSSFQVFLSGSLSLQNQGDHDLNLLV